MRNSPHRVIFCARGPSSFCLPIYISSSTLNWLVANLLLLNISNKFITLHLSCFFFCQFHADADTDNIVQFKEKVAQLQLQLEEERKKCEDLQFIVDESAAAATAGDENEVNSVATYTAIEMKKLKCQFSSHLM